MRGNALPKIFSLIQLGCDEQGNHKNVVELRDFFGKANIIRNLKIRRAIVNKGIRQLQRIPWIDNLAYIQFCFDTELAQSAVTFASSGMLNHVVKYFRGRKCTHICWFARRSRRVGTIHDGRNKV